MRQISISTIYNIIIAGGEINHGDLASTYVAMHTHYYKQGPPLCGRGWLAGDASVALFVAFLDGLPLSTLC